jgi:hypothetical protein
MPDIDLPFDATDDDHREMEIGSLRWAESTGGRLSRSELVRFLAVGMRSQLGMLPARVTAALGLRRAQLASLDLEHLRLPDSKAAQEAEAICSELPTYLASHSQRTYLWGSALGTHDGLDYDEELLYISCLLHDRGLPPAVERRDEKCFTLASASVADEHARRSGWPKERAASLSEAITLHLNPWVSAAQGIEAHLLNAGAAVDVAGLRRWELHPETVTAVVRRHPRADFKRQFRAAFGAHAQAAPRCRVHTLLRYGLFGPMIRHSPFDE